MTRYLISGLFVGCIATSLALGKSYWQAGIVFGILLLIIVAFVLDRTTGGNHGRK